MTANRDAGQALAESILLGLLLLVPLIWALGVLSELQRGALATTAAAREAGFEVARSGNAAEADRAAAMAVREAFADHGLDPEEARFAWSGVGLERGSAVRVEVSFPVPVLGAPLLGGLSEASIWVRAQHVARVDPFASRP